MTSVDDLANRMIESLETSPPGSPAERTRLVDLCTIILRDCMRSINSQLAFYQAGHTTPLKVHYVITVPTIWDEMSRAVMRKAATAAGTCTSLAC